MQKEQVLIVGVKKQKESEEHFAESMKELQSLTKTAGGEVVSIVTQNRDQIHPATYIGKGKLAEIKREIAKNNVDLVISNDELSAGQLRNLINELNIRLIDRSQLILDIFTQRAQTKEGQLQVELAQLEYLLPRLRGQGTELSRLGGGIGTRGPGETKLETDQRHIRERIHDIKRRLKLIVKQREQYRKRRRLNDVFQIALVGYTNAGKSTIFNRLTEENSLEEDLLFATLDPLTRKIELPSGFEALLTDTVGFLQELPTTLIAAFRSTLEEVVEADLIVHVVDASHTNYEEHERTVFNLLEDLGASEIPILTVYNKKDLLEEQFVPTLHPHRLISAYNSNDLQQLLHDVEELVTQQWLYYEIELEPSDGRTIHELETESIVKTNEFNENINKFVIKGYMRKNHRLNRLLQSDEND